MTGRRQNKLFQSIYRTVFRQLPTSSRPYHKAAFLLQLLDWSRHMFWYFSVFFLFLACIGNLWLIVYFIKSKGENPPFIASWGKPKKEIIWQADLFLKQNPHATTADLGCGSAGLLIPLAKKFPHHNFVGYEWDILPYMLAIYKTRNLPNITILYRDFFKEDLSLPFDFMLLRNQYWKEDWKKIKRWIAAKQLSHFRNFQIVSLGAKKKLP